LSNGGFQSVPGYPILLVLGPSISGETEWANSFFKNPLELKIGTLPHFPDRMRTFDRKTRDGIILDDMTRPSGNERPDESLRRKRISSENDSTHDSTHLNIQAKAAAELRRKPIRPP
jgi:hypothetical protein